MKLTETSPSTWAKDVKKILYVKGVAMKVRKSRKSLKKAKKLEPTKALRVAHNDYAIKKLVDIPSPQFH